MSVQYPYRAVICGEKHIVKGWRGRKLVTDKDTFAVRHIYGDQQIQSRRFFEVATIQADGNGSWLVNGKPLSLLELLPFGERLADIPRDENLRVYEDKICAVAWFDKTGTGTQPTELLDLVLKFWSAASLPVSGQKQENMADVFRAVSAALKLYRVFAPVWSSPIWLTEFLPAGRKIQQHPKLLGIADAQPQVAKAASGETAPAPIKVVIPKIKESAPSAPECFLSYKDAAEYIGVSERTIKNWKKRSWLKVEKIGKKVRIAKTDLDKCKTRQ
jgi:excisionase family DNA binding protein